MDNSIFSATSAGSLNPAAASFDFIPTSQQQMFPSQLFPPSKSSDNELI